MKYKTLFRIICKALGVYFIVIGASGIVGQIASVTAMQLQMRASLGLDRWWMLLGIASPLLQLVAGRYLLIRGDAIVNLAVPSNRPYCPDCGYDLSGSTGSICPECGTDPQRGKEK